MTDDGDESEMKNRISWPKWPTDFVSALLSKVSHREIYFSVMENPPSDQNGHLLVLECKQTAKLLARWRPNYTA